MLCSIVRAAVTYKPAVKRRGPHKKVLKLVDNPTGCAHVLVPLTTSFVDPGTTKLRLCDHIDTSNIGACSEGLVALDLAVNQLLPYHKVCSYNN